MRFKFIDRVMSAVSGLIILVIGVGLFVFGAGIFPFTLDLSFVTREYVFWQRAVMVAAAVALCFLGLRGVALLFRSGREKGFIAQHTEYGDLSISMSAMENMVRKCVDSHDELKVASTRIHHVRDGVVVAIRISLAGGVNIPITVSALQKQIKQYITSCSGVDVREVRVMVETNNTLAPTACDVTGDTLKADADAADKAGRVVSSLHGALPKEGVEEPKPKREPLHQRLFKHEEKPQIVPQAPVADVFEEAEPPEKAVAAEPPAAAEAPSAQPEPEETPAGEAHEAAEATAEPMAEPNEPDAERDGTENDRLA